MTENTANKVLGNNFFFQVNANFKSTVSVKEIK